MTILFQFVTPPPPQPRPQLPASVRGSALSGVDWFFTTVAAVSFLLHLIFVIYLRNVDWPRKPDIEAVPDRFVQMVVKKEEKKPEPKKVRGREDRREKKDEKKKGDEEKKQAEEGAHRRGEGEARRGEGQGGRRAARAARGAGEVDRPAQAAGRQVGRRRLDRGRARQGRRRPRPGEGVPGRRRRRRRQRQRFAARHQVGRLGLGPRGRRGQPARRRRHRGRRAPARARASGPSRPRSRPRRPPSTASWIPNMVAKEVRVAPRRHQGLLRARPEAQPEPVAARSSSTGRSRRPARCRAWTSSRTRWATPRSRAASSRLIARWRFPAPSGGSVDVSFPFVFQASQ